MEEFYFYFKNIIRIEELYDNMVCWHIWEDGRGNIYNNRKIKERTMLGYLENMTIRRFNFLKKLRIIKPLTIKKRAEYLMRGFYGLRLF